MVVQGVGQESYSMVRQGMQGNSSGSSEVTALQRLAAAGSEPLLAVGRALGAHLVHSLGSTTSVALTGGLSLIRLGVGKPLPSRLNAHAGQRVIPYCCSCPGRTKHNVKQKDGSRRWFMRLAVLLHTGSCCNACAALGLYIHAFLLQACCIAKHCVA